MSPVREESRQILESPRRQLRSVSICEKGELEPMGNVYGLLHLENVPGIPRSQPEMNKPTRDERGKKKCWETYEKKKSFNFQPQLNTMPNTRLVLEFCDSDSGRTWVPPLLHFDRLAHPRPHSSKPTWPYTSIKTTTIPRPDTFRLSPISFI